MVGGELTMDALELRFEPVTKIYEAPLQMKANGGMFLIDDFGRQQISPQQLLNRWIVPLETRIDFLRLQSGQTLEIPFRQLIVFATNLDPSDLVDAAFLRRIQMKVEVSSPGREDVLSDLLADVPEPASAVRSQRLRVSAAKVVSRDRAAHASGASARHSQDAASPSAITRALRRR